MKKTTKVWSVVLCLAFCLSIGFGGTAIAVDNSKRTLTLSRTTIQYLDELGVDVTPASKVKISQLTGNNDEIKGYALTVVNEEAPGVFKMNKVMALGEMTDSANDAYQETLTRSSFDVSFPPAYLGLGFTISASGGFTSYQGGYVRPLSLGWTLYCDDNITLDALSVDYITTGPLYSYPALSLISNYSPYTITVGRSNPVEGSFNYISDPLASNRVISLSDMVMLAYYTIDGQTDFCDSETYIGG